MKTPTWGSTNPLDVWNNPNLRWGSPYYRLEAGDPGYGEWYPPRYTPPKSETRRRSAISIEDLNLPPLARQGIPGDFVRRRFRMQPSHAQHAPALSVASATPFRSLHHPEVTSPSPLSLKTNPAAPITLP